MSNVLQVRNLHVGFQTLGGVINAVNGISFDIRQGNPVVVQVLLPGSLFRGIVHWDIDLNVLLQLVHQIPVPPERHHALGRLPFGHAVLACVAAKDGLSPR